MKKKKSKDGLLSVSVSASIIATLLATATISHAQTVPGWKSYSKDPVIERRVDSVLKLMTLDEKIGQLTQFASPGQLTTGAKVDPDMASYIAKGQVGSILNAFSVPIIKRLQQEAVEKSRLHIPILFGLDVVHGYKTTFPTPLAESCSWDLDLMEKTAHIAGAEAAAGGINWTFAPMVDIARDPRWGRVMEGAGEDPYYGGLVAQARVRGFQGNLKNNDQILACVKHFGAYGAAEAGRDYNTVDMSLNTLYNVYLKPYQAAVKGGAATFMTAFDDLNGVPCTANRWLLTDVLRNQWGFDGMLVTDYTAVNELVNHGIAEDEKHAAILSLNAGVDMDMQSSAFLRYLKQAVQEGKVKQQDIDIATCRVLEMKFILELFDNPYHYLDAAKEKSTMEEDNAGYINTAKQIAQESIVLLQNKNNILPLSATKKQTIALIGPFVNSSDSINGSWGGVGESKKSPTVQKGIQSLLGNNSPVTILNAKGCGIQTMDTDGFAEAIEIAKKADVIVLTMGEADGMTGEAASYSEITIPGVQRELIKQIAALKKPTVLVLMNGRPLDLSAETNQADAILETWFLGRMGGAAIADVLFGKYNPGGKLTVSFPRNIGQVPVYYNHFNTGRPIDPKEPFEYYKSNYRDIPNTPLFAFGHGLSYTTYKISNMQLSSPTMSINGKMTVTATVANTGNYDGYTVIQLYIRDLVGSITRPVKELKAFKRIYLKKGETQQISFELTEKDLAFYNQQLQFKAEPGNFKVWVAQSSDDDSNEGQFRLE